MSQQTLLTQPTIDAEPFGRDLGTATVFPTGGPNGTALRRGDVCVRSDLGTNSSLWQYTGVAALGSGGWTHKGPIACTSTARPAAALYAGLQTYETDTHLCSVYDGAVWAPLGAGQWVIDNPSVPAFTASSTTEATITGTSFTATVPAGRQLEVEMIVPAITLNGSATGWVGIYINGAKVEAQLFQGMIYTGARLDGLYTNSSGAAQSIGFYASAWIGGGTSITVQGSGGGNTRLRHRIL